MKAFLSHSSKNKPIVQKVAEILGAQVVEMDSNTFDHGLINVAAIQDALKKSSVFVLFLTQDAIESGYVKYEALMAAELQARGVIERFLVLCLDEDAFKGASEYWNSFNFVRKATSINAIARMIQSILLEQRLKDSSKSRPFIGRTEDLTRVKDSIVDPKAPNTSSLFISGNAGIGRRAFARQLFGEIYRHVNPLFPEIDIDSIDGYDEIYRKLLTAFRPIELLSAYRARIAAFAMADDSEKARLIAQLFELAKENREAVVLRDTGGLLHDEGNIQSALSNVLRKVSDSMHPLAIMIAERMVPKPFRDAQPRTVFCSLNALPDNEVRQLCAMLLKQRGIAYTDDDLDELVKLADGHPLNVYFIAEAVREHTLPVFLADTSYFTQWKHRRASQFLQKINFSDHERVLLSALKDFPNLTFDALVEIVTQDPPAVAAALVRLMDLHIVEGSGHTYRITPPLRVGVERSPKFSVNAPERERVIRIVANLLRTTGEDEQIAVSMLDTQILAAIEAEASVPALFEAFLLPSHYVWLARRKYNERYFDDARALCLRAVDRIKHLSPAGKVEACRLLCLASIRTGKDADFERGIKILEQHSNDSWARSNVNFLKGFYARHNGRFPDAEKFFRNAVEESPGNFSALHQLASICLVRGDTESAEVFARRGLKSTIENDYVLNILLSALLKAPAHKLRAMDGELSGLFDALENVSRERGRSFFETRKAEHELRLGHVREARGWIDKASEKTSGLFDVIALRAEISLEGHDYPAAFKEIERLRAIVFSTKSGEKLWNLRPLLSLEASYFEATKDFDAAKRVYARRDVFTAQEERDAVKRIEYTQAMRKNKQ